ncbi:MAG: Wzy polymerase domain-containing protein [Burkholderiales bacterium]|nr:Wzy polymerase domain-containing protein [Burkholderiales bacterium]
MTAHPAASRAASLALLFAGATLAFPFLLPEHRLPITSFYDEWLAVALGGAAVVAALFAARARAGEVPEASAWFALLALWLGVQPFLRSPAYLQLPAAGIVFLGFAAALAWAGRALRDIFGAERAADLLASFLVAAGVFNAVAGILQAYGVPRALEGLFATSWGERSVGHVAQANTYACYLAAGQASLLYLLARRKPPAWAAWACGTLLAVGIAYSHSRTAVLYSVWLAALAWFVAPSGREDVRRLRVAALAIGAGTLVAIFLLPPLHDLLGIPLRKPSRLRMFDPAVLGAETRPMMWALSAALAARSPLAGTGWGEFAGGAFEAGLPPLMAKFSDIWSSPHNLFAQVLAEGGVVAGAIVVAAFGRWWWAALAAVRREQSPADGWVAAVAGVVCIHAMLEYPLWYAHVLALLALVAGMVRGPAFNVPVSLLRTSFAAGLVGIAVLLAWTFADYQRFESAFRTATGRTLAGPAEVAEARKTLAEVARGPLAPQAEPWLHASLALDAPGMLEMGERVLRRAPDAQAVARHAAVLALAGRREEAEALVANGMATFAVASRERLEAALGEAARSHPDAAAPLLDRVRAERRPE